MTDLEKLFQESKAREEKATVGPWLRTHGIVFSNSEFIGEKVCDCSVDEAFPHASTPKLNSDFIAAARTEVGAWRETAQNFKRALEVCRGKFLSEGEDRFVREIDSYFSIAESLAKQTREKLT